MVNGSAGDLCTLAPGVLFVTFRGKSGSGQNRLLLEGSWLPTYLGFQEPRDAAIRVARFRPALPVRHPPAVLELYGTLADDPPSSRLAGST